MKYTVLKQFKDRYTKSIYSPGETIEVDIDRANEINSSIYGQLILETENFNDSNNNTKESSDIVTDYKDMTVEKLIKYAEDNQIKGITKGMKKDEIINLIEKGE